MTKTGNGIGRQEAARAATLDRDELARFLDGLLDARRFADYCPNGLQVEGARQITRIVCGVTASLALVEAAVREGAQAVLVHHGWFWRGDDPRVIGPRRRRLATLLAHDISLFAYHLPLDVHPEYGNNVQLARQLGWPDGDAFGKDGLLRMAELDAPGAEPLSAAGLAASLRATLGREPLLVGELARPIRRIAWCTGGAHDSLQQAIDAGADAYLSGEIAERTTHLAREAGVIYAAAGHHATERYGVQALGQVLRDRFGLEVVFVDDPNPV
jgi:dinuclear metal center YbgI/SA1388 family protein